MKVSRELIGKRALITGSTAGIGKAIALRLADEGATHIAIHGRNKERLEAVAAELEAKGVKVHKSRFDISDKAAARQMVRDVIEDFGGLDIVINNAGMGYSVPFLEVQDDYLDFMCNANFNASVVVSQEAAKWMIANHVQGVIMLNAALSEYGGLTGQPIYSAVKAAMINLVKSASRVLAPYGIRMVAVSPGFTNTMAMDNEGDEEAKHVRAVLPTVMPRLFFLPSRFMVLTRATLVPGNIFSTASLIWLLLASVCTRKVYFLSAIAFMLFSVITGLRITS